MIGYFHVLYKDVTIFSIGARYSNHTGALSENAVFLDRIECYVWESL